MLTTLAGVEANLASTVAGLKLDGRLLNLSTDVLARVVTDYSDNFLRINNCSRLDIQIQILAFGINLLELHHRLAV